MPNLDKAVFRYLVESLPVGLLFISPKGGVELVNAAMARILGLAEERIASARWADLFLESEANEAFNDILTETVQRPAERLEHRVPYLTPAGERKLLSVITAFLHDHNRSQGLMFIVQDMTELNAVYERERAAQREMARLHAERLEGLNRLSMSVSHQIRNPLTAIGGNASSLLRRVGHDPEARQRIETVLFEARRLEAMTKAISAFASLGPAKIRTVSAAGLLQEARQRVEASAAGRGKTVSWQQSCLKPEMRVDPVLFAQALDAVLQNALDFCREAELRVEVEVRPHEAGTEVRIRDQGPGIAEADLPFVFDPFFTTRPDAVGMGLTSAKRIMVEHRGLIEVASGPGRGVEVTMRVNAGPPDQGPDLGPDEQADAMSIRGPGEA
ncbi:MAG: PAS domain-containing protein [Desulfovibrionaceae bacterium]|nr:PAS domain-containing protein [Desulfovibrionaceae bacterium]